ncbi:hypothetical protein GAO09_19265 [Rhizobiales bacterium RZME27]|uniref:Uncharacterized protein n=1 Tax=Endobacterium cereale TaxID=2663029 RepID=A0A6A8AE40_9HYPH|nr:hypothetical protein [Endobacterium cereale]MQY48178.1 hypothetical protein [Endobacterium cereale]
MANGNDLNRSYTDAVTAQLGERVTNLGRRQTDLETEMRAGFKAMESGMSTLANEMRASVSALSANLAERSRTQWPVIWSAAGVCTAALIAAGTFVYGTLSTRQDRLDTAMIESSKLQQASISKLSETTQIAFTALTDKMVTRQEMDWRQARGAEDRNRMEGSIKDVRDAQVPRAELERVWSAYDQRLADHQRQLDESKQAAGSVYGARDVILDLRERLDRVERQRLTQP